MDLSSPYARSLECRIGPDPKARGCGQDLTERRCFPGHHDAPSCLPATPTHLEMDPSHLAAARYGRRHASIVRETGTRCSLRPFGQIAIIDPGPLCTRFVECSLCRLLTLFPLLHFLCQLFALSARWQCFVGIIKRRGKDDMASSMTVDSAACYVTTSTRWIVQTVNSDVRDGLRSLRL